MATLVDSGPIRGPDRPKQATKVEDIAEEAINAMFCTYEPPVRKIKTTRTKGILRPAKSFQRERSTDTARSVRWIDDSDEDFEKAKQKRANEKEEMKRNSLRDSCNSFAQTLLETSVEAGCMSPTGTGLHKTVSADSSVSLHRESKAQRYAVFDENGNPVSSKPGEEEPPKPPPTPPPSRNEVFIPQLCGVELNCVDEDLYETARPHGLSNKHSVSQESEDDNSLLESGVARSVSEAETEISEPKQVVDSKERKGTGTKTKTLSKDSSWRELRDRLDAESDWDGPDWMEAGGRTASGDELEMHGRYAAGSDVVVSNRSDVSSSHVAEKGDDWDQSVPVIPKNKKGSRLQKKKTKDLETVQETESGVESGDEEGKKKKTLFGRFRSKGNDPPTIDKDKQSDVTHNDERKASESEAGDQDERSSRRSLKDKFRRRHNRSKSPSRRFLRSMNGKSEDEQSQTESSRLPEKDIPTEELEDHDAPMPYLHPAHPLNQVRLQLQIHGNPNRQVYTETIDHHPSDDRMSYITAHRNHFAGEQNSQPGVSDNDDRMSYITAHRRHTSDPNPYAGSTAGASDYHDRMSHIMEHRAHLGDYDNRSHAHSDFDRMSFITASRQHQAEGSIVASSVNEHVDRQSNIGAYRESMDSPMSESERASPRTMMQRLSLQTENQPPPPPKNEGENAEEETQHGEDSWETKTRLAWERIRNGFDTSSKPKGEGSDDKTEESEKSAEGNSNEAKQGEEASSIFSFLPAFITTSTPENETTKEEQNKKSSHAHISPNQKEGEIEKDDQAQKVKDKEQSGEATQVDEEQNNETAAAGRALGAELAPPISNAQPKGILKAPLIEKKVTFGENSERTISPKSEDSTEEDDENAPPSISNSESEDKESPAQRTSIQEEEPTGQTSAPQQTSMPTEQTSQPLQTSHTHTNAKEVSGKESQVVPEGDSKKSMVKEEKKASTIENKKKTKKGNGRKFFKGVFGKGKKKPRESSTKAASKENGKNKPSLDKNAASSHTSVAAKTRGRPQSAADDAGFLALSPVHGGSFFMDSQPENHAMYQRQMQWQLQNQMPYGYPGYPMPMASYHHNPNMALYQDMKALQTPGIIPQPIVPQDKSEQVEEKIENQEQSGSQDKIPNLDQEHQDIIHTQSVPVQGSVIGQPQQSPKHHVSIHDRLMQHPPPPSIHDRLMQQQHPSIHDRLMHPPHYPSIYDQMLLQQNGYFYSHQPHFPAVSPAENPTSPAGPVRQVDHQPQSNTQSGLQTSSAPAPLTTK